LGTLTQQRPKPLVPVCGEPVLIHILRGLRKAGITEALLVIGYLGEMIRDALGTGEQLGIALSYAEQETPSGTGSALLLGREFAQGQPILSVYGDILTDPAHYTRVVGTFCDYEPAAAVGINPVEDPCAGAAVYLDADRIVRVVEKPPAGTANSNWNLAGISVYSAEVWDHLAALKPSFRGEYEVTDAIQSMIVSGAEVRAVRMESLWSDIGTPQALKEAEEAWRCLEPGE
jgi:glucose-1-phosphate thymidylyltransferase